MFRAKLPLIFITSHGMPRLPRNLHLVAKWRSPANAICKKTRRTPRLERCACHEKWRWTRPKCCSCHENRNASSENVAKVLRLPHKTTFDTLQKTSECHKVPRLPREMKQHDVETSKNDPFCRTYHRHGHMAITRTVANGCGRLRTVANGCGHKRNVERTHPQPPDPQSETGTLATHSGTKRIPKNMWLEDDLPETLAGILKVGFLSKRIYIFFCVHKSSKNIA